FRLKSMELGSSYTGRSVPRHPSASLLQTKNWPGFRMPNEGLPSSECTASHSLHIGCQFIYRPTGANFISITSRLSLPFHGRAALCVGSRSTRRSQRGGTLHFCI